MDGTVHGNDSCNTLNGRWEMEGDTLVFPEMMADLIGCGPARDWFRAARTARLEGATLRFYDSDGVGIDSLPRY